MKELILLRHGESQWNAENRFTGWEDVPLSDNGRREARMVAQQLRRAGFRCGAACSSVLGRAIHTLHIVLAGLGCPWVPEHKDWRLNEKHYGLLQGRDKREVEAEMGAEMVRRWRRAYDCPPPPLPAPQAARQAADARYAGLPGAELPLTESLRDTHQRVRASWETLIRPRLYTSGAVLVVAHGNSLRALVMHLRGMSPLEVESLEIPTCQPIHLVFDDDMRLLGSPAPLGDESMNPLPVHH